MNCYECHPRAEPAVAVCSRCGKGLCHEHTIKQELSVLVHVPSGMAHQTRNSGRSEPRMLCGECFAAQDDLGYHSELVPRRAAK